LKTRPRLKKSIKDTLGNVLRWTLTGIAIIITSFILTIATMVAWSNQHHRLLNSYDCEVMPY